MSGAGSEASLFVYMVEDVKKIKTVQNGPFQETVFVKNTQITAGTTALASRSSNRGFFSNNKTGSNRKYNSIYCSNNEGEKKQAAGKTETPTEIWNIDNRKDGSN
jgi:hypothetical protein